MIRLLPQGRSVKEVEQGRKLICSVGLKVFNLRRSTIALVLALLALTFQQFMASKTFEFFIYTDEIIVIVLLLWFVAHLLMRKNRLEGFVSRIIVIWGVACILAAIGNALWQFQESGFAIAVDVLNVSRFFIVAIVVYCVAGDAREVLDVAESISKVVVIVLFSLAVVNAITDIGLGSDYRYGIRAFTFGSHAGLVSGIMCPLLALLLRHYRANGVYIIFAFGVLALTMRTKAFALIVLAVLLMFCLRRRQKISLGFVVITIVCIIAIGYSSFYYYFLSSDTASRGMALRASFEIANNSFPFGGGLGTFGSVVSTKYYSRAYIEYGLSQRWGFMPDASSFVGDGGWASIIAQFGWIGLILFLAMIVILFERVTSLAKYDKTLLIPALSIIGYSVIAGTSETFYFSQPAVGAALVLGLLLRAAADSHSRETNSASPSMLRGVKSVVRHQS